MYVYIYIVVCMYNYIYTYIQILIYIFEKNILISMSSPWSWHQALFMNDRSDVEQRSHDGQARKHPKLGWVIKTSTLCDFGVLLQKKKLHIDPYRLMISLKVQKCLKDESTWRFSAVRKVVPTVLSHGWPWLSIKTNGGFLKTQIIHVSRMFPYKQSILGYPHLRTLSPKKHLGFSRSKALIVTWKKRPGPWTG